eukprot:gene16768-23043_t
MRCLKIFLEHLGLNFLNKQGVYGMAGFAILIAVDSLYSLSLGVYGMAGFAIMIAVESLYDLSLGVYGMAGFAIMIAVESLYDLSLLNCRPSVVAAALLYSERRLRGAVPFWPSMLAKLTGYEDMAAPELMAAVHVAQKLARSLFD